MKSNQLLDSDWIHDKTVLDYVHRMICFMGRVSSAYLCQLGTSYGSTQDVPKGFVRVPFCFFDTQVCHGPLGGFRSIADNVQLNG